MVLEVSDTQELVGWILHFGSGVQQESVLRKLTRDEKRGKGREGRTTERVGSECLLAARYSRLILG